MFPKINISYSATSCKVKNSTRIEELSKKKKKEN